MAQGSRGQARPLSSSVSSGGGARLGLSGSCWGLGGPSGCRKREKSLSPWMVRVWWEVRMWYPFPAGQISLKAAVVKKQTQKWVFSRQVMHTDRQSPCPPYPLRTGAICWAALTPRTPGLAHTAAAELSGEACGERVLALVLRAHQAETQALLLRLVCCGGSGDQPLLLCPSALTLLLWPIPTWP